MELHPAAVASTIYNETNKIVKIFLAVVIVYSNYTSPQPIIYNFPYYTSQTVRSDPETNPIYNTIARSQKQSMQKECMQETSSRQIVHHRNDHDTEITMGFVTDMKGRKRGKHTRQPRTQRYPFLFSNASSAKTCARLKHGSEGAKIPADVRRGRGGHGEVSMHWGGCVIRYSIIDVRSTSDKGWGRGVHSVTSVEQSQATRPQSRGPASPETEADTDDLEPKWVPSQLGLGVTSVPS